MVVNPLSLRCKELSQLPRSFLVAGPSKYREISIPRLRHDNTHESRYILRSVPAIVPLPVKGNLPITRTMPSIYGQQLYKINSHFMLRCVGLKSASWPEASSSLSGHPIPTHPFS